MRRERNDHSIPDGDVKRRDLDTPGRRARRAWNRGPALEREIVTLGETLAILEANYSAFMDKGDTARAIETQRAIDNCVARFERAQEELAILRGKAP